MTRKLLLVVLFITSVSSFPERSFASGATGIESDKTFQKIAPEQLQNFSFNKASAREIGKTFAALFKKELVMNQKDDVAIDLPKMEPETVGNAWARFVTALRDRGLDIEGTNKIIRIYSIHPEKIDRAEKPVVERTSDADIVPHFDAGKPTGYAIIRIVPGSIYDQMGFKNGDTITEVNGRSILDPAQMFKNLFESKKAHKVTFTIIRDGKKRTMAFDIKSNVR